MHLFDLPHAFDLSPALSSLAGLPLLTRFGAVPLILSLLAAVLVLQRRDSLWWLVAILLSSPLGPLLYFISLLYKRFRPGNQQHFHQAAKSFLEERRQALEAALEQSDTIALRSELGECYMALQRYQEAKNCFDSCLRGNFKHDPLLLYRYAEACHELEEFETAMQALKKTFELDYSDHLQERRYLKALLHAELGEDEEALAGFKELNGSEDSLELFCRQALIYQERQEFEKADAFFLKTIQLAKQKPIPPEAKFWLQLAQDNLGKKKPQSSSL